MKYGKILESRMRLEYKKHYIDYKKLKQDIIIDKTVFVNRLKKEIEKVEVFYGEKRNKEELLEFSLLNLFSILKITKKYNKKNKDTLSDDIYDLYSDTLFYKDLLNKDIIRKSIKKEEKELCSICYYEDNYIVKMKCSHSICWNCILRCYLSGYNKCGMCRYGINMNPIAICLENITKTDCNPIYLPLISQVKPKKCIFIGIDGIRPDCLLKAKTPNIDNLIDRGVINFETQVTTDSYSAPSWSSILSGLSQRDFSVYSNEQVENEKYTWKTRNIFKELNEKEIKTYAYTSSWAGMNHLTKDATIKKHIISGTNYENDVAIIKYTKEFINKPCYKNIFIFMYLSGIDKMGHHAGFSLQSTEYIKSIEKMDLSFKSLFESLYLNNYSIIVSTDHGGSNNKDLSENEKKLYEKKELEKQKDLIGVHGLELPQHKRIFQIYYGDIVNNDNKEILGTIPSTQMYHKIKKYFNLKIEEKERELCYKKILLLGVISIYNVKLLTYYFKDSLENIFYKNSLISIDGWFFIHIFNNLLLVYTYKQTITYRLYMLLVIGWEVLENCIIPNLFPRLYYFKEPVEDTIGDLIAAIPGACFI